ncbi:hypothetical protein PoB_003291300 [Plakobranchus ocellatus]|uniref:Uncharacterized protein n=1 Tax=Plakobranchus ocellatus TaxID=259542 RepID=A0AAV4AHX7_9GAST|nr:hypothetical protein PoB_003291300 [Plakobranchus ocellatus]
MNLAGFAVLGIVNSALAVRYLGKIQRTFLFSLPAEATARLELGCRPALTITYISGSLEALASSTFQTMTLQIAPGMCNAVLSTQIGKRRSLVLFGPPSAAQFVTTGRAFLIANKIILSFHYGRCPLPPEQDLCLLLNLLSRLLTTLSLSFLHSLSSPTGD